MKKIIAIILCFMCYNFIIAQFSVSNTKGYLKLTDPQYNLDALILLNGIDDNTTISYTGNEQIEWRYTIDNEQYNSNQASIIPESDMLYTLYVDGTAKYYIYTIDYTQYPSQLNTLDILEDENKCQQITLNVGSIVPEIKYLDKTNTSKTLTREFKLNYENAAWQDSAWIDITADTIISQFSILYSQFSIPAPYKSTTFKLYGDTYENELGIYSDTLMTDYTAISVKCYPRGTVVEREYQNEKDRSSDSEIEGSGPLVVEFESRANPLDIVYYEWFICNVETPNNYQRYNDENLRYTFEKTGEYKVKLVATSNTCEYTDSLNVRVLESYIEAPNVFTPNGDGINDEWRVAYKSIERYQCIIQNRWGRTVFKSTDPGKGWDGMIGNRPAAEGTYYYVIVAYGTDKFPDNHKKAGKQTKYKLAGDINLLR
ncbi:MAG: gliding motility-associated C-terminal domain-containing protein [Paludibacteraceae bacterium]|nr:gliding motility-associated C-terminal domain-containing protein [Paludibacteraceae bacterium]